MRIVTKWKKQQKLGVVLGIEEMGSKIAKTIVCYCCATLYTGVRRFGVRRLAFRRGTVDFLFWREADSLGIVFRFFAWGLFSRFFDDWVLGTNSSVLPNKRKNGNITVRMQVRTGC